MALPNPGMDFTALDPLTAAEMDDIVENIEALADGSGLDDGAVTNPKLNLNGSEEALVATGQSTSSGSFTDLSTVGPTVTVDIGVSGCALVVLATNASGDTAVQNRNMGFAISGATTRAAVASDALQTGNANTSVGERHSYSTIVTGLTPGSTTFTAKYSRFGSGNATFTDRKIQVMPF